MPLYQTLTSGQMGELAAVVFGALHSSSDSGALTPGTGHAPGDLLTLTGGTFTTAAKVTVLTTQAISATVVAGGTGGTNGAVTVTGTTGTGTKCQFSGTISGNALTGALTLVTAGSYSVNPTTPTAEPVTGGSLTGATINVTIGVLTWIVTDCGNYTVLPTNPVAQGSSSGSGVNAAVGLVWGPIAAAASVPARATVTQASSRATAVTANAPAGAITLFTAAGSATEATFTVNNKYVAATDIVHVSAASGTNVYETWVTAIAAGSFNITFKTSGGTASDAPVFNYFVMKATTV